MSGGYGPVVVTGCLPPVFGVAETPFFPCPMIWLNAPQQLSCPPCFDGPILYCPSGKFSSLISQADADAQATNYLAALQVGKCSSLVPVVASETLKVAPSGSVNYQSQATNTPTSYGATGLPAWLSLNTTTGIISGNVPATLTTYSIPISATNTCGTGDGTLTIIVAAAISVSFTHPGSGGFKNGLSSFIISIDGGTPFAPDLTGATTYNAFTSLNMNTNLGAGTWDDPPLNDGIRATFGAACTCGHVITNSGNVSAPHAGWHIGASSPNGGGSANWSDMTNSPFAGTFSSTINLGNKSYGIGGFIFMGWNADNAFTVVSTSGTVAVNLTL